jgi:CheY-like chemotaxis protein
MSATVGYIADVHVLLAADADWLVDDVVAALGDIDTSFTVCSEGREVSKQVTKREKAGEPSDVAVVDLQIGSMGGIAVTMALRLDASVGNAPNIPILVLLDRVADVHLAKRSGANGWLVKPLDPLRLRRAVRTVAAGGSYTEGLPQPEPTSRAQATATGDPEATPDTPSDEAVSATESSGPEPVAAG